MKKSFLRGIIGGLGFLLTLIIGGFIYIKAFSNISNVSNGQVLTASTFNDLINRVGNIFFNSGTNNLEINGGLKISSSNSCDSSNKGVLRYSDSNSRIEYCNGTIWQFIPARPTGLGADSTTPGLSCKDIKDNSSTIVDGLYRIKPSTNSAIQVRCDMINGGRTLVTIINSTNHDHVNSSSVNNITDKTQTTSWKITDEDINSISKTIGYKLECGGTTYTYSASCSFSTTTYNGSTTCYPGGGGSAIGVSNRPNISPNQIYGHSSTNGCYAINSRSNSGKLRVK